jgi:hypothetical protein
MNAGQLAMLMTILECSSIGGIVAASEKVGWFTILLCVIGGLALGIAFALGVGKLAYFLLDAPGWKKRGFSAWAMCFACLFIPQIVGFGAMALTGWLTFLIVRHVS